jgi:acetoin utilization deacetylase AcuC-like enzyme
LTEGSSALQAIPVFYADELLADSESFSPSAGKPRLVFDAWRRAELPIDRRDITPASLEDFYLAHDPAFVQSVLMGLTQNGFGNERTDVARSLPFTTGAMINAADAAVECGVACAPVSGFHHAGYAKAAAFCTFNGLMVTAVKLLRAKRVARVLILDLDQHYGNGTHQIKRTLRLGKEIVNATFGRWYDNRSQASQYMMRLRVVVKLFSRFDLVLYQAGADLHVDDPLGGVLDTEQMRERDAIVFEAARRSGVPLAWNLAGGYQEPISNVVRIHTATMEECVRAYVSNSAAVHEEAASAAGALGL